MFVGIDIHGRFEKLITVNTTYQHIFPGYDKTMKFYDIGEFSVYMNLQRNPTEMTISDKVF